MPKVSQYKKPPCCTAFSRIILRHNYGNNNGWLHIWYYWLCV